MAGSPALDDTDDKPLDPAVERVRRKLVRFIVINLAILFVALMAVVGALVYRTVGQSGPEETARFTPPTGEGQALEGVIDLPAGARILSHAASGDRLTLHVETADGAQAIHVYDMAQGRTVARFAVSP
mgnify:CR=1 FL=1